ncbi:MAG: NAD(P) transhydrogenase subunit alpha [Anaerolineaceae bacterium 4572_78]|nr:MAG: NAD(P) transhydrogenase subunit alpha [Anaerolineaceae bacterium 4572_78]
MKIAILKEIHPGETRVAMIPAELKKMTQKEMQVEVEAGIGQILKITDDEYKKVGATVVKNRQKLLKGADIVLRLNKPPKEEIDILKKGAIHISHLDPFNEKELVEHMAKRGVSTICMEMIPRTTLAQKMDSLSSQASLAGYVAVILAADRISKAFPMMMTPAGTLAPSRVFIIGAGVAGLQAIATAKRLGARVEAFDTRPVVAEQVQSLGAKFVKIDLGETGQTEQGYAKQLTKEQIELQRQGMAKHCAISDVVITTAKLFGRKAPIIITKDMVAGMKPGSVIIDMATETGGNVEGSAVDKEVDVNGVNIIGLTNLEGRIPYHASQMYASNLRNLIEHFWDKENNALTLDLDDEIIDGCLITHKNEIRSEMLKEHYAKN